MDLNIARLTYHTGIYNMICHIVCGNVLRRALEHLFKGYRPVKKHLLDKLDPALQGFHDEQKDKLRDVMKGKAPLNSLDVDIFFRLLQRTCGLANLNSNIWEGKGELNQENILEHYILRINRIWSEGNRRYRIYLRIMDHGYYQERIIEVMSLLHLLIDNVAKRTQMKIVDLSSWKTEVDSDIRSIMKSSLYLSTERCPCHDVGNEHVTTHPISPEKKFEKLNLRLRQEELEELTYIAKWNEYLPGLGSDGDWRAFPFLRD